MADSFEQISQGFDVQHYLGIARRRPLHFLIPAFLGWLAVWGISWLLPASYKSSTLILVEEATMPKDYVVPNINEDLQERLQSMTEQILSRTRLHHIIEGMNLYQKKGSRLSADESVQQMRKDISVDLVRDPQNHITAFNVAYSASNPNVAQEVTGELTKLFIDENLEVRQQQSEGTTKFLENQLETARQALSEQEKKVREFKVRHVGELPTQLASNMQILGGLQAQLQTEEDALNTAKQQRVYLETLIGQYRTLQGSPGSAQSVPIGLPAIDGELDKLKAQLADLSSRYTELHPDVRKLKDQIAKNEKMRDELLADLKNQTSSSQSDEGAVTAVSAADPTQAASPTAQLQSQLRANEIEIKNREQTVATLKAKVDDYQARLNQEPVSEQQLTDLSRGYDQSKATYDELLKKKNESALATNMELLKQGQRFRVLDPPSLPLKPVFPNRLEFCGIGLLVGLVLGAATVGAFEMLDDRIYDEKELKGLLPVTVISEIPLIVSPFDEQENKKRIWLEWATAALVLATILAGSAVSYLRG
jgi:polysaccharide biosynthesis transport protein